MINRSVAAKSLTQNVSKVAKKKIAGSVQSVKNLDRASAIRIMCILHSVSLDAVIAASGLDRRNTYAEIRGLRRPGRSRAVFFDTFGVDFWE